MSGKSDYIKEEQKFISNLNIKEDNNINKLEIIDLIIKRINYLKTIDCNTDCDEYKKQGRLAELEEMKEVICFL